LGKWGINKNLIPKFRGHPNGLSSRQNPPIQSRDNKEVTFCVCGQTDIKDWEQKQTDKPVGDKLLAERTEDQQSERHTNIHAHGEKHGKTYRGTYKQKDTRKDRQRDTHTHTRSRWPLFCKVMEKFEVLLTVLGSTAGHSTGHCRQWQIQDLPGGADHGEHGACGRSRIYQAERTMASMERVADPGFTRGRGPWRAWSVCQSETGGRALKAVQGQSPPKMKAFRPFSYKRGAKS